MRSSRRVFITHAVKGGLFVITQAFVGPRFLYASIDPTPEQTAGPYFKEGAPLKQTLHEPGERGMPLMVSGDVVDPKERPLPNARIEVWHADPEGSYDMEGFRYRGQIPINAKGQYTFGTVLPGNYGGRPKHIHYRIAAPDHASLFTQLYFENDPFFGGDPDKNFRRDPILRFRELIRPVDTKSNQLAVFFRICLKKI